VPVHAPGEHPMFKAMAAGTSLSDDDDADESDEELTVGVDGLTQGRGPADLADIDEGDLDDTDDDDEDEDEDDDEDDDDDDDEEDVDEDEPPFYDSEIPGISNWDLLGEDFEREAAALGLYPLRMNYLPS
jgi:ribonuclease E